MPLATSPSAVFVLSCDRACLIRYCSSFAGVLSYYRNQSDEGNVSRGSISMTVAKVEPPGTDKLKFVVGSKIDRSSSVYLKGNRAYPPEGGRLCSCHTCR